jgi:hypothetical protein
LVALEVAATTFPPVDPAARAFTPISGTASAPTASTSTPIITALFIFISFSPSRARDQSYGRFSLGLLPHSSSLAKPSLVGTTLLSHFLTHAQWLTVLDDWLVRFAQGATDVPVETRPIAELKTGIEPKKKAYCPITSRLFRAIESST